MRAALRLVTVLAGGGLRYADFLAPYVDDDTLPLWLRLRETSGTTAANSGGAGATLDGTWAAGSGAVGQTGKLGANEAYRFDGAASLLQIAASALLELPAFTAAMLVNANGNGENTQARFFNYANANMYLRWTTGALTLTSLVAATGNASAITSTAFTTGAWQWVFMTYDDAGDRLIHLYRGISGTVAECCYATQDAATGTKTSQATNALNVGNRSGGDFTFDGLIDEFQMHTVVRDTSWMLNVVRLSGV